MFILLVMDEKNLVWKEEGGRVVFNSPVFAVEERFYRSPENLVKTFTVLDAADWAIVIPVIETERSRNFVMVRQWRHGARELSLEFPGGVFESGEQDAEAARRELEEETAYTPGKIKKLGVFNPNPALMSNHVHFFLAWDLQALPGQNLDDDEYIAIEMVPEHEVLKGMGRPPFIHALMGTAVALYLKEKGDCPRLPA
ncbi:MAG: NUDIX hydrolase [Treponema sp.]|jgi:8-oxo-dGTP pyrophosphatase MutT (NUDIX family)|nr:NUDIX hydrolase [Treponema sp.]